MSRSRRPAATLLAAAVLGLLVAIAGGDSNALGPVIAITPFEVTPQFTEGNQPVISGRGETVGVFDQELNRVSFVQLDQPGPDGNIFGRSITVSGNNCVALWTDDGNGQQTVVGLIDRCQPANTRVLFTLQVQTFPMAQAALSFDGRFAALQIGGSPNTVYRIDTAMFDLVQMPTAGLPGFDTEADRGIDISDDGNIIVVAIRENFVIGFRRPVSPAPSVLGTDNRDTFVAAWDVAAGQATVVSTADGSMNGSSAYPSVSGDGRYVAFAADRPRVGGETSRGPWVYVRDRASSAFVRISDPAGSAFYTSISRDATQVAYGAYVSAPTPCVINDLIFQCPPDRINVAFGSSPGLGGGFQTETVSVGAAGEIGGGHYEPSLSGNGRWIAWRSDIGDVLVGSKQGLQGRMHAFTRRRDPGMSVDALDFGTITVSTSVTLTTTVRNTGRTTNSIDSLVPTPGQFTVQPGGSCVIGMTLPPGGSCTVNIRFAAPAAATTVNGTLVVAEAGYDPISATGTLIGRSTTGPTIPPAVTTTTTTLPPGSGTPRPTTTTTTTIPKNLFLDAAPDPIDFGQVAIGIPTAPQTITVTNTGNTSGQLFVSIFGDHPDDFEIVGSTCEELILVPAATCTIEIRMNARDGGDRTALATITTSVGTVEVVLRGQGRFSPRLAASPQAVTDRAISTIIGQGYPPNDPVLVQIVGTPVSFNVTADAAGMFRIAFSPLGKLSLGSYTLHVDALPTVYELIETPLVVVLPTFKPQGPTGPAFGTSLLVTRGG